MSFDDPLTAAERGIALEIFAKLRRAVLNFAGRTADIFGSLPHIVIHPGEFGLLHPLFPQDPGAEPLRMVDQDMKRRPLDRNAGPPEPDAELGEDVVDEALVARVVGQPSHDVIDGIRGGGIEM